MASSKRLSLDSSGSRFRNEMTSHPQISGNIKYDVTSKKIFTISTSPTVVLWLRSFSQEIQIKGIDDGILHSSFFTPTNQLLKALRANYRVSPKMFPCLNSSRETATSHFERCKRQLLAERPTWVYKTFPIFMLLKRPQKYELFNNLMPEKPLNREKI